jgi:O-antigen/teichoic acid export membrane protein
MNALNSTTNIKLIKNSLYLFYKLAFTLIISLYCSRLVLQELGVVDYGIYNVVGGVVAMLSFITGAMASSTQRFLSFEIGNNGDTNKIFSMSINIYLLIILIVLLISQTIGVWFVQHKLNIPSERIDAAYWVFQAATVSFIFAIYTAPYNAVLIAYEKMKVFSLFGIATIILRVVLILGLTVIPGDKLLTYAVITVGVTLANLLLPLIYVKYLLRYNKYIYLWDIDLFKTLIGYTGWNLFGNLSAVGFNQGINILLNLFFGPAINAARGISSQVNAALLSFSGNLNTAINPQIIKNYSSGDKVRMIQLVFSGSKYTFLLLSIMSIPILINMKSILTMWLGTVPPLSVEFTTLVIIDTLICGFSGSLMTSIQATGRIKYYQLIIGGILLLNIPLSYSADICKKIFRYFYIRLLSSDCFETRYILFIINILNLISSK